MNYLNTYITEKHVPADFEKELRALTGDDLRIVSQFLEALGPSSNAFHSMYTYVIEISARDKKSISDIFSDEQVQKIIENDKRSRKEKLSLVRKRLELLRFPEKNKIQDTVASLVSDIRKEYSIICELPDELEGDTVHMQFSIKSTEDLKSKIRMLQELDSSHKVENLFDILMGRV